MSRIIQEQTRHFEIVQIGKETDEALELHRKLAAEFSGASRVLREFAEKGLQLVFEKVTKDLDENTITLEEATKARVYLSQALHEANRLGRTADAQRLREEGAAGVLQGMVKRLEARRDVVVAKIDALEAHENVQVKDDSVSIGGAPRGGIMAQRRAERLAEEAAAAKAGAAGVIPEAEKNSTPLVTTEHANNAVLSPGKPDAENTSAAAEPDGAKNPTTRRSKRRPDLAATAEAQRMSVSAKPASTGLAAFSKRTQESSEKLANGKTKRTGKGGKLPAQTAPAAVGESPDPIGNEPIPTPSQAAMRRLTQTARKLSLNSSGQTGRTNASPVTESIAD